MNTPDTRFAESGLPQRAVFVFAGGGTGGHIYPGLAVAAALRARIPQARIIWFGSETGMDRALVEQSGAADAFYGIPAGRLRRYWSLRTLPDCFRVIAGFVRAFRLLRRIRPDALFSKGGYVSVPPCFAARLLRIRVFTHECDLSPGLATRLNARCAALVFVSYRRTVDFFPPRLRDKIIVTGNPVRPEFYHASAERGRAFLGLGAARAGEKPVLLVIGGSSGSRRINELTEAALPYLTERFIVVHQTGYEAGAEAAEAGAEAAGGRGGQYLRFPFIYGEMSDVIAAADVVFSRAGANALSECAVLGKPLVLLPLTGRGTRGDQAENAAYFAERGAAIALDGETAGAEELKAALERMLDAGERALFSENIRLLIPTANSADMIGLYVGSAPLMQKRDCP